MEGISKNNQNIQTPPTPPNAPIQFTKRSPNPIAEDLDSMWLRWKCLVCGYLYEGATPLKICPRCGNSNPDKFDDVE